MIALLTVCLQFGPGIRMIMLRQDEAVPMKFTKMQGIGNDFIVVDGVTQAVSQERFKDAARRACDRKFGIGADGLILVLPSAIADFRMRIFNADGSEAEMCGNGIRCVARFVYDHGLANAVCLRIETLAGIKQVEIVKHGLQIDGVRVDMGSPILRRSEIPMNGADEESVLDETVEVDGRPFQLSAVSMGNPHVILFGVGIGTETVLSLGPRLENHELFPSRTNVQFAEVKTPNEVAVRTWERGSGVTLACGTGACATVVAGFLTGRLNRLVTVHLAGGDLQIEYTTENTVFMTGPAEEVYDGEYRF